MSACGSWVRNASTSSVIPPWSRLSPRYMTNGESPRNGSAVSTPGARAGGAARGVGGVGGLVLDDVGDPHAELAAVAGRGADLVTRLGRDDDPDLGDPRLGHRLD